MKISYVHGYDPRENIRLQDQASTLVELLHSDTSYPSNSLKVFLKPGGTITVIEGDHGSAFFYPDSPSARKAIQCQVELQKRAGGNAMVGRELYPLLQQAGFRSIRVSPRMVYVDSSKPPV